MIQGYKKSPLQSKQRTSIYPWYHLNLPRHRGLFRSQQTVSALPGAPVSAY